MALSPDDTEVAAVSDDGTVRIWNTTGGDLLFTATSPGSSTNRTVDFDRDGRLVSLSADGNITVWGENPASFGDPLQGHVSGFPVLAASPDGKTLVAGGYNGLRFWDAKTGKPRFSPSRAAKALASAVAFSPDGKLLAEAANNGDVRLWRAGDLPRLMPAGRAHVGAIAEAFAFGRDGLLAFGANNGRVYLWNTRTPGAKPQLVGAGRDLRNALPVFDVAFSPNGRTLASGGYDGTLRLWSVTDASHTTPIGTPDGMKAPGAIRSVAFSPSGRLIAVGSADGTISFWDATKRKQLRAATPDSDSVESVAFTGGGQVLVTAGDDGVVRFWDVGTLRPLGQLVKSHVGKIRSLALSRDASVLATAQSRGNVGDVRLWRGIVWRNNAALTARICRLVAGGIADAEWKAIIPAGVKQLRPHLCGT
jgi:WD40 repeat protein